MLNKLKLRFGPSCIARFYNNYTASWMVFFKRFEPALARYQDSLKRYNKDERAKHCLANLYVQEGQTYSDPSRALQLFDELMAEHPSNPNYPFNAAFVLQKLDEHSRACVLFEQALVADKHHDRAWYGLALSQMAQGDWVSAQTALEQNTRLQPMSPYGWYQLAIVHAQLGDAAKAHKTMRHLYTFEPKFARGLEHDLKALRASID